MFIISSISVLITILEVMIATATHIPRTRSRYRRRHTAVVSAATAAAGVTTDTTAAAAAGVTAATAAAAAAAGVTAATAAAAAAGVTAATAAAAAAGVTAATAAVAAAGVTAATAAAAAAGVTAATAYFRPPIPKLRVLLLKDQIPLRRPTLFLVCFFFDTTVAAVVVVLGREGGRGRGREEGVRDKK